MRHQFPKQILFVVTVLFCSFSVYAGKPIEQSTAQLIDYEEANFFKNLKVKGHLPLLDQQIQVMGRASLSWSWEKNNELDITGGYKLDYDITTSGVIYAPVFVLYLHNEQASDRKLKFILTDNLNEESEFTFGLNFTGWRTAWIRYSDMEGKINDFGDRTVKNIKVIAPNKGSGNLKFGPIIPNARTYQALPMADLQVPYLMDGEDEHRGPGVSRKHLDVFKLKLELVKASEQEIEKLKSIETLLAEEILQYGYTKHRKWEDLKDYYKRLNVGSKSKGLYISFKTERAILPSSEKEMHKSSVNFKDLGDFLNDLAVLFLSSENDEQKDEIRTMFTSVIKQMQYYGWGAGHSRGTIHNVGYKLKTFMSAIYLMRDVLIERELLSYVRELSQWLTNAKECLLEPHDANLDYFHTFAQEQLITHLLNTNNDEKITWLKKYSQFISLRMSMQTHDDSDGFKYDGTAFHHFGHYPDYAIGALEYASKLIYLFKGSKFEVTKEAHENVINALLQMRIYANKYNFPNALTGRHPFTQRFTLRSNQVQNAFYYLTKAGSVDGKEPLNITVGSAYLRLYQNKNKAFDQNLKDAGLLAESSPVGHWPMNNAANSIHRRSEWMVSIKGYSKYVWNAENWDNANRYGVFHSHGAVEILLDRGLCASGYKEKGWNWSRLPGTTAMNVPNEILNASITGSVNRKSSETFVGGVHFNKQQGAFGMVLNDEFFKLKARKSVFCFDNRIICLGSNISAWNQNYDTETTLFQNALSSHDEVTNWDGLCISDFPYKHSKAINNEELSMIEDNVGNAYFIMQGELALNRTLQHSNFQNTGKSNHGKFSTAVINHGRHPKDASYEYAILVQPKANEVSKFKKSFNTESSAYDVLQHDAIAHVVKDRGTEITGCVLFEAGEINIDCIKEISQPIVFMVKGDDKKKLISICQPDLKWEYTRPFSLIYMKLEGNWDVQGNNVKTVSCKNNVTLILIECLKGMTHSFECYRTSTFIR